MKLNFLIFVLCLSLVSVGSHAQTITILSPNGGENLLVGDIVPINWTWTGVIDSVKVEYSTNGGGTWTLVETKTLNDSICGWNIPNKPGNSYLVKVTDASNPSILDISDNLFSVTSSITVTAPVGGDNWEVGSLHSITWDATSGITDVKLEYSTNSGTNWTNIVTSTPNTGYFPWNIPNKPSSNTALIRVTDVSNTSVLDMSDLFSISTSLTVTSPNGGENWEVGSLQNITWNASSGISNVKIEYSTNGGGSWLSLVASTFNTGVYGWKIPDAPYNTCRIKITDVNNTSITDMSNNNFAMTSSINVIYPNGGEIFYVGEEQIISYGASPGISMVKIEYSINNGSTWAPIITAENDSSVVWNIPNKPSTQCFVRISDNAVTTVYDASDDTFEINTGVKIEEEKNDKPVPKFFSQSQNVPNPFGRETIMRYAIPENCMVILNIYDVSGKKIRTLVQEKEEAGYKIVRWNGTDEDGRKLPTGVYFYIIKAGRFSDTKKFILLN